MNKKILGAGLLALALAFVLTGCGKKDETKGPGLLQTAKTVQDMQKVGQDYDKAQKSGNPEDMAKALQNYGDVVANLEIDNFEKTAAVAAPSGFPSDLIYSSGKIVGAEDSSDENYVDQNIELKTKDSAEAVKEFYTKALAANSWKISSQKSESNNTYFTAKNLAGLTTEVDISFDLSYSKLVNVKVYYRGDK